MTARSPTPTRCARDPSVIAIAANAKMITIGDKTDIGVEQKESGPVHSDTSKILISKYA